MAQAGGLVAGADVARDLGKPHPDGNETSAALRTIVYAKRFQDALWTLFRAPRLVDQLAEPETLVCRCEEISLATIRQAIDEGCGTAGAVKRLSRAGMGRCQGRYCGAVVVDLVARAQGNTVDEFSFFAPRFPFRPVPVAAVSAPPS
ncbi:MAG: (2Fe-2S)-binding protein [Rhizobiaceae bacterium]|nr:(2Fe-2S)-binding protein [Rhizobiaceae bacterium]